MSLVYPFHPLQQRLISVSYTHLRAHETVLDLVCRLLLEKKKTKITAITSHLTSTYIPQYNIYTQLI